MAMSSTTPSRARVDSTAEPDVSANLASFSRHLRAKNKAPPTIVTYAKADTQLNGFPERDHRPRAVADLRRETVEARRISAGPDHERGAPSARSRGDRLRNPSRT